MFRLARRPCLMKFINNTSCTVLSFEHPSFFSCRIYVQEPLLKIHCPFVQSQHKFARIAHAKPKSPQSPGRPPWFSPLAATPLVRDLLLDQCHLAPHELERTKVRQPGAAASDGGDAKVHVEDAHGAAVAGDAGRPDLAAHAGAYEPRRPGVSRVGEGRLGRELFFFLL